MIKFIEKVNIEDEKVDIESVIAEKARDFTAKTVVRIRRLFDKFGGDEVFGRSTGVEPVSGYSKGKYRFRK